MQRTLSRRRQREVEGLARTLLEQSLRVNPYDLADRAKVDFFLARGVLRMLANQGQATEFPSGSFGRPTGPRDRA
jgi:ribosomal protein S25